MGAAPVLQYGLVDLTSACPMYSIIISTLAYPFIAWWMHRRLDDYLEPGALRKLIVFLSASMACWVISVGIDAAFPSQAIHLSAALTAAAPTSAAVTPQSIQAASAAIRALSHPSR